MASARRRLTHAVQVAAQVLVGDHVLPRPLEALGHPRDQLRTLPAEVGEHAALEQRRPRPARSAAQRLALQQLAGHHVDAGGQRRVRAQPARERRRARPAAVRRTGCSGSSAISRTPERRAATMRRRSMKPMKSATPEPEARVPAHALAVALEQIVHQVRHGRAHGRALQRVGQRAEGRRRRGARPTRAPARRRGPTPPWAPTRRAARSWRTRSRRSWMAWGGTWTTSQRATARVAASRSPRVSRAAARASSVAEVEARRSRPSRTAW